MYVYIHMYRERDTNMYIVEGRTPELGDWSPSPLAHHPAPTRLRQDVQYDD